MLNFSLANFYNGYAVNQMFLNVIGEHRDYLKRPIAFNQITGSFPFNSWNGDINSNIGENIPLNDKIDECFKNNILSLRLNFANMLLDEKEFYNNYNRVMLEKGGNGATAIELCNLQLYEYLKTTYPTYKKFILSPNAKTMMGDQFTPEVVNVIGENEDFQLISLPPSCVTEEFLSQVKCKSKIEICINPLCPMTCKHYDECVLGENKLQFDFSGNTMIAACAKRYKYDMNPNIIPLEELDKYTKQGITHFKLSSCPPNEMTQYFLFLVKYFIKEEYQQEIIEQGFLQITGGI